jgi:hypothetical protein
MNVVKWPGRSGGGAAFETPGAPVAVQSVFQNSTIGRHPRPAGAGAAAGAYSSTASFRLNAPQSTVRNEPGAALSTAAMICGK